MTLYRKAAILGAALAVGLISSPDARAQVTPVASKADPVVDESSPDPLTPPQKEAGPLTAPGAESAPASTKAIGEAEKSLTAAAARIVRELASGARGEKDDIEALAAYYGSGDARAIWVDGTAESPAATAARQELQRAADYGLDPAALRVPDVPGASADDLARFEARFGLAVQTYARHARGGRVDPPSLSRMIDMKPRLFEPRSVLAGIAGASDAAAYLRGLHPKHPGYHKLKDALVAARAEAAAPADTIQRIVVNLERWRWMPEDLGDFHVWDNVPEQYTRVMKNGKVVLQERIVVGKPNTPTPLFSADMKFVIFHPSWGVPGGIKANELGPQLRRASESSGWGFFAGGGEGAAAVLRRHDLRVSYAGRPVDPASVNWSSVDISKFHFTQPPGSKNVLGIVKFRFPNRFDVYMHDTPERHLFNQSNRTFSHGCMRVQNPVRLAEVLLDHDRGMTPQEIANVVAGRGQSEITLRTTIPVHITYFTATVDDAGKLHTHPDIYGQDGRVATALAGKQIALASAAPASDAPQGAASARKRVKTADGSAAKPTWNPFRELTGP